MKKRISMLLAILLLCFLMGCGAATGEPASPSPTPSAPDAAAPPTLPSAAPTADAPSVTTITDNLAGKTLNRFKLDVTLDTEAHTLEVSQLLSYCNNTGTALDEIYFNLIPGAFGEDGGGIDVHSVKAAEKELSLEQEKQTVYRLALSSPLAPEEILPLQMDYTVRIPEIQNRFGYQENVYNLGNFIITPAVYDADGWAVQPYTIIGDAFYTDIADYDVTVHAPDGYTVAATGRKEADGSFHAEKVRDFAFCASDGYSTLTDTADGVDVTVYYGDDMKKTAVRMLETSKKALSLYSELFGAYPYDTLSVVASGLTGGVSGMEYPTLIMVRTDVTLDNMEEMGIDPTNMEEVNRYVMLIDRTVTHEIAHQWFYGIVGNDQVRYPWLDEGMCRFAECLYEQAYPPPQPNADIPLEEEFKFMHEDLADKTYVDTTDLNTSLYGWMKEDPIGYSGIYVKGASLLYQMMEQMGKGAFQKALREYVDTFAYGFATSESFVRFWNGKDDFSALFESYFAETQSPE